MSSCLHKCLCSYVILLHHIFASMPFWYLLLKKRIVLFADLKIMCAKDCPKPF
uniref:TLC domain-containing protein n=1 Tax=Mesocestoides corti TaxID=53468 RepID=A0A5K3F504_MESCO